MRSIHPSQIKTKNFKIKYLILILVLGTAGYFTFKHFQTIKTNNTQSLEAPNNSSSGKPIKFIATGDWIAHGSINTQALQSDGKYNYMPMVQDFLPIFKNADIKFCNDPILNGGESLGISGYPKFNSPTEFVTDMGKLGCNLVNTASNHSFDYTQANINNSVSAWQSVPKMLAVAGENQNSDQQNTVHYFSIKGLKFAFLAYTAYSNNDSPVLNSYGVNTYTNAFAQKQIDKAKSAGAKFIIVSIRWGTEYSTSTNPEQIKIAQYLADQGVNLILGHGSHELQPVAQIKGANGNSTLVWYSLGNFLNAQEPPETLFNGIVCMNIDPKTQAISNIKYLPIYMHYEWTAAQQIADDTNSRNNLHLYLLENARQSMLDSQQLKTTIPDQKARISNTLNSLGLNIPLISSQQLQ
jgi:poly-gamma-glutamate synthesis protein (capsule biosynthesis protein)